MPNPRIILWDLETTNLNADFGYIICGAYKVLGEKPVTLISIRNNHSNGVTNDKKVVEKLKKDLSSADMWVTWFGTYFDIPFLQSRLLYHGLSPMPPVPHVDGWYIAKKKLHIHSNRLASVSSFLGIEEKTKLDGPLWIAASAGDAKAQRYVEEHCVQDVKVLEQAYNRLKALTTTHPNVNLMLNMSGLRCPVCSSTDLKKGGFRHMRTGRVQRYQCGKCHAWSQGKPMSANVEAR